jgi:hypothetical protein
MNPKMAEILSATLNNISVQNKKFPLETPKSAFLKHPNRPVKPPSKLFFQ